MQSPLLAAALFEEGAAGRLIDLVQHRNFDVAAEAFSSLRELLLAQKEVSSAFLHANFEDFFWEFNQLLQVDDYVTRRPALRLLGEIMLDRGFMEVMSAYVSNERFLQIHMNLLRHSSKAIQLDAFHVFKVFAANPNMPRRVQQILYQNREKLAKLIEVFIEREESDAGLTGDLWAVLATIQDIQPPQRTPTACKVPCGGA